MFATNVPTKPEEMEQYEKITALVRPSQGNVVNAGKLKPGDVCRRVEPTVKTAVGPTFTFNASSHHPLACRFYKIKPKKGEANPEKTDLEMCQYDAAHKDYVYTEKWVMFLIEEMKKPGQYQKILASRASG